MTEPAAGKLPDLYQIMIDEDRARLLGHRLRQAFDEVVAEPLPDAFADLLRRLD